MRLAVISRTKRFRRRDRRASEFPLAVEGWEKEKRRWRMT